MSCSAAFFKTRGFLPGGILIPGREKYLSSVTMGKLTLQSADKRCDIAPVAGEIGAVILTLCQRRLVPSPIISTIFMPLFRSISKPISAVGWPGRMIWALTSWPLGVVVVPITLKLTPL